MNFSFIDNHFLYSILIGFAAQMVGSSLGMAYSVTCSSVLLAVGISPAMVSASVHTSEVVNRLASGLSHASFGNVNPKIFKRLAIYGMLGAFLGAFVLTSVPVRLMRPIIAFMLLLMGLRILLTGLGKPATHPTETRLGPLGFIGGLVDVIGGGGWGPVVAGTLIMRGNLAHIVVGSINLAKFFVAVVESATLIVLLRAPQWDIIAGLIAGGVVAAPMAAWSCRKIPPRFLTISVGTLVCALSIRTLVRALL